MSKLVGPAGRVHAFEPNPVLCSLLGSTIRENASSNISVHQVALGEHDGVAELTVPFGNAGAGSLLRRSPKCQSYAVKVTTLDAVVADLKITSISLIKLDVEGFELFVLKGANRTLSTIRPRGIIFESNDNTIHERLDPVMQLLSSYNYRLVVIPKRIFRMSTKIVRAPPFYGHDFLAVANEAFLSVSAKIRAN